MYRPTIFFIALAMAVSPSTQSSAELIYSVDFEQDTYVVSAGGTVAVKLLLTEEATAGETLRLASEQDDDGLLGFDGSIDYTISIPAGMRVTFDSATAGAGFLNFATETGSESIITDENGIIDFQTVQEGFATNGVSGNRVSDTVYEIELGTFIFNAASTNSTTTLQIGEFNDPAAAGYVFADLFVAPASLGSAQIVTVPEPCSLAVLGLAAGITAFRRRK